VGFYDADAAGAADALPELQLSVLSMAVEFGKFQSAGTSGG
jgi:hypothetical protein